MQQFTYEPLGGGVETCVSAAHTFGTDAFLLSYFASPQKHETACDLGSGCGIVPLLWMRDGGPKKAYAVDIQPMAIEQIALSVKRSALEGRIVPLLADLRDLRGRLPLGSLDLVTCNPPYKAAHTGVPSQNAARLVARHETLCTLEDVCHAGRDLLRFGGRLCLCQLPERLVDLLHCMRQAGVEPKRMRFVQQKYDTAPWLVLVEGKRGSKPFLALEPPLILKDDTGGDCAEMRRVYSAYRAFAGVSGKGG